MSDPYHFKELQAVFQPEKPDLKKTLYQYRIPVEGKRLFSTSEHVQQTIQKTDQYRQELSDFIVKKLAPIKGVGHAIAGQAMNNALLDLGIVATIISSGLAFGQPIPAEQDVAAIGNDLKEFLAEKTRRLFSLSKEDIQTRPAEVGYKQ
jgi:hypothetical protein